MAIINTTMRFLESFGVLGVIELLAALVVAVGCGGELWILINRLTLHIEPIGKRPGRIWHVLFWADAKIRPLLLKLKIGDRKIPKAKEELLERLFVILVAFGVSVEFVALPFSLNEIADLNEKAGNAVKSAALANERAATNELTAKQLDIQLTETKTQLAKAETRLIELRIENSPMDIGDQKSLAEALKSLTGINVKLRSALDSKAQQTAEGMASAFKTAGWLVVDRRIIEEIGRWGVLIGYNVNSIASKKAAHLLLKQLVGRDIPCEILDRWNVKGIATNEIIVAVMTRSIQLKADLMVVKAKDILLDARRSENLRSMSELMLMKFPPNSKELAEAQKEFNDLNSEEDKLNFEQMDLSKKESKLSDELEKQLQGTNSIGPGVHVFGSRDTDSFIERSVFGTNATVIIRNANLPQLEVVS